MSEGGEAKARRARPRAIEAADGPMVQCSQSHAEGAND